MTKFGKCLVLIFTVFICLNYLLMKMMLVEKYCCEVFKSRPLIVSNTWSPVRCVGGDIYTYSAFYQRQKVIIIGARKRDYTKKSQILCRVKYNDSVANSNFTSVDAQIWPILEAHSRRFSASIIICKLPNDVAPTAVSVSCKNCETTENFIAVSNKNKAIRNFTVCVSPFHSKYDNSHNLVEMIELNKILGADHFVFYNYSTGANVDRVLNFYIKRDEIEVLQWEIPLKVQSNSKYNDKPEIHYYGQLAALNDCVYRNRGVSKYIVFQDLDEYIIPRNHMTWHEMMTSLPIDKGAYLFRSSYFRTDWPSVNSSFTGKKAAEVLKSITILKQTRENYIFSPRSRSKYIANPDRVDIAGIHFVWSYSGSYIGYNVDAEIALLHHYKQFSDPSDPIDKLEDRRIMTYKNKLIKSMSRAWKELKV